MTTIIQNITKHPNPEIQEMKQSITEHIEKKLARDDFLVLSGREMRTLLMDDCEDPHTQWTQLQESWQRLQRDTFMADGGKYRLRRHAIFHMSHRDKAIAPAAYKPHYQSLEHNKLNGGVARHFDPLEAITCNNLLLIRLLALCGNTFSTLMPGCDWHIEVHQFRIETSTFAASPTPEGVHRDGVNFVFMMMINRQHINGGATFVYDRAGALLHHHTLEDAMESVFINDEHLYHGVSPVTPTTTGTIGYRDMLVITFRKP